MLLMADEERSAFLDESFQRLGDEKFEHGILILAEVNGDFIFAELLEDNAIDVSVLQV